MSIPITSMRDRTAGALVIEHLLDVHDEASPRSAIARFFGASPLTDETRSWYQGAVGEIAVGRMLSRLPADWSVFHALPIGTKDADIDHLVVGPGGVFTINTKHHSGKPIWVASHTFMVSGNRQPYLRNAVHEADRVGRMLQHRLTMLVQPMIVLVDARSITVREKPERVQVMDARHLVRWLGKCPVVLDAAELVDVVRFVEDPATWREGAASDPDLMVRFERLDREVRSALSRNRLWSFGFAGVGAVTVFAVIQVVVQWMGTVFIELGSAPL